jgi:hypothetical protein
MLTNLLLAENAVVQGGLFTFIVWAITVGRQMSRDTHQLAVG